MVIILKETAKEHEIAEFSEALRARGFDVIVTRWGARARITLVGDVSALDCTVLEGEEIVARAVRVEEPFKLASRAMHPENSVVTVGGVSIGGGSFTVIAGPCAVESEAQILHIAREVKKAGASMLRGGAFKPRTSPYDFQGMGEEGVRLLAHAGKEAGLPIVSEIVSEKHVPLFEEYVDLVQIGARNMQNYALLKAAGRMSRPILLKRGISSTYGEWLMAAEYILSGGNRNLILCERGIRTFETYTRNTFDVSAFPSLKQMSHLPILGDPSHAAGQSALVGPLCLAACAAGADGLTVEVHGDPARAKSDGRQSVTPGQFAEIVRKINLYRTCVCPAP